MEEEKGDGHEDLKLKSEMGWDGTGYWPKMVDLWAKKSVKGEGMGLWQEGAKRVGDEEVWV